MSLALLALGVNGPREADVFARVCVWCDIPHFLTDLDRQAHEQGAQATHGMCPAAEAKLNRELEAAKETWDRIEADIAKEKPCATS